MLNSNRTWEIVYLCVLYLKVEKEQDINWVKNWYILLPLKWIGIEKVQSNSVSTAKTTIVLFPNPNSIRLWKKHSYRFWGSFIIIFQSEIELSFPILCWPLIQTFIKWINKVKHQLWLENNIKSTLKNRILSFAFRLLS